jgi:hypothetical protein
MINNAIQIILNKHSNQEIANFYLVKLIADDEFSRELSTKLLNDLDKNLTVVISDENILKLKTDGRSSFFVILSDKLEKIGNLLENLPSESWIYRSYFVIIAREESNKRKVFSLFWKFMISNVNILVVETLQLELFTNHPFKHQSCHDMQPIKINEFTSKWATDVFFPMKFADLHRCPLKVMTYESAPAIIIEKYEGGKFKISGFEGELFNALVQHFNFSVDFYVTSSDNGTGALFSNGNVILLSPVNHNIKQ